MSITGTGDIVIVRETLSVNGAATFSNTVSVSSNTLSVGSSNVVANNGYSRITNDLLMQWGSIETTNAGATVVFPVAFNALFQAVVSSNDYVHDVGHLGYVANTTELTITSANSTNVTASWIAIGT